jgi:hypothetical protein
MAGRDELETLYREVVQKPSNTFPFPRDQLVTAGVLQAEVDSLTDTEMWALHRQKFGGVSWKQMRTINEGMPFATTEWFLSHPLNRQQADAMVVKARRKSAGSSTGTETDGYLST